jgi:hypothetical protein
VLSANVAITERYAIGPVSPVAGYQPGTGVHRPWDVHRRLARSRCRASRDRRIPAGPGLYRIRRAGQEPGLEYIGQTGWLSLWGRLGQLTGVYRAQMPYREDMSLRAPDDACDVIAFPVPATRIQRQARLSGPRRYPGPSACEELRVRHRRQDLCLLIGPMRIAVC